MPYPERVLVLIPDAFGSNGGISKFNRDLLTALCAHPDGVEVVALPRLMPDPPGPMPKKLTWVTDGLGGKLRFLRAVMKIANRPAKQPKDEKNSSGFDLLICGHINLLPAAFLARKLMRRSPRYRPRARCPILLAIHGLDAWEPHKSLLVRTLSRRVDAFISVSEFTKERFVRWSGVSPAKGHLLPNCVDLTGFGPGEKDPALLERYQLGGRKVLMTLGRLLPDRPKGIDEVMEALPSLIVEFPELSYLICGDGPDRPRLADKARSLGLTVSDVRPPSSALRSQPSGFRSQPSGFRSPSSALRFQPSGFRSHPSSLIPQVIFAGRISESEKAAHYRLADAFVMPGYGEGFGIVYLEALACGIPVLASTLDASREALLDGEMGLLVDPRNRDELRQGLRKILQQPRGQVPPGLERFSYPSFARRCQEILVEELNG